MSYPVVHEGVTLEDMPIIGRIKNKYVNLVIVVGLLNVMPSHPCTNHQLKVSV